MPCAFSRIAISTVTPQTIMITFHGIRLIASRSSAAPRQHQSTHGTRRRTRPNADVESEEQIDADEQDVAITASVTQCRASNVPSSASSGARPRRRRVDGVPLTEQLQAAEQEVAAERDRSHARAGW